MYFFEWPYGIGKRESARKKNNAMQCSLLLPFLFVNCFWIDFNLFLFRFYSLSFFLFFTHTIHNNSIAISGPMWNFYQRNICHSKFKSIWWHNSFLFLMLFSRQIYEVVENVVLWRWSYNAFVWSHWTKDFFRRF